MIAPTGAVTALSATNAEPVHKTRDLTPGIHRLVFANPVTAPDCIVPDGGRIKSGFAPALVFMKKQNQPASPAVRVGKVPAIAPAVVSTKKVLFISAATTVKSIVFDDVVGK